ncbi:class I adenylate-forming enzyme family protein [Amycolatopsis benzoatilytica]|uniref:class I adenylate-forming enzyme family protein n=1 Tax=Amycolatopsis benzoatilytica TaxID=346045 RepID=UPI00036AF2A0|nr:class I adenylate-forming enzyme family protein [Amycolatopsis benzoatilytica]
MNTFEALWRESVRDHGEHAFLLFRGADGARTSWSYGQFDETVDAVAARLRRAGVGHGSAVHLVLRNCPAFVALWLAASRLGAWIVPVDPESTARDIARQAGRIDPVVTICAAARLEVVQDAALPEAVEVIALHEDARDLRAGSPLLDASAAGAETGGERRAANPMDRLAVMFTSGTTSEPKGVELTQANYAYARTTMAQLAGLTRSDRWYVCLPLFHANAQYYCFASAIAVGASVALTARFTASRWPHEVAELGATHASLFAAPIRMILARLRDDAPRLRLRHVWFAQNLAEGQWRRFAELCGTAPRQIYGMTETLAVVTANPAEAPDPARIGTAVAGRAVRLIDPATGAPVPDGEPGVITVAGRRGVELFAGYLENPQANARAFPPLPIAPPSAGQAWLSTGDLARRCPDGQLAFVGRSDDVIKVAGENVSLTEVEAALAEAPGVLEAAVVAVADPIRDHVPAAFIVPADPAAAPTAETLETWADSNLTPAARPRTWTFVDQLPRTSVGKIRRFQLTPEGTS